VNLTVEHRLPGPTVRQEREGQHEKMPWLASRGLVSQLKPVEENLAYCPSCRKDVRFALMDGRKTCSECGYGFDREVAEATVFRPWKKGYSWWLFLGILLAPGWMMLLAAALPGSANVFAPMALFSIAGSAVACGIWLACYAGKRVASRILLALLLIPLFAILCSFVCFAGCAISSGAGGGLRF
jgi:hypothetical protein